MSAMLIVLLMILVACLPLGIAVWFFRAKRQVERRIFLAGGCAGVFAVILAALVQLAIAPLTPHPSLNAGVTFTVLYKLFVEIALTEEAARFLTLLLASRVLQKMLDISAPRIKKAKLKALGLTAGFAFAAVETIFFTATNANSGWIRAISAAPLHGACGIRAASSVFYAKTAPHMALISFAAAALLHGIYNFLAQRSGVHIILSVALSLTALFSGIQSIKFDEENDDAP